MPFCVFTFNQTIHQAFVLFHVMFKLLGVNAFQKLTLVHNLASTVRKAMYHHFELITKAMSKMMIKHECIDDGNNEHLRNWKQGEDLTYVGTNIPWRTSVWYTQSYRSHQYGIQAICC